MSDSEARSGPSRWQSILVLLLALAILIPSLLGFGTKFLELVALTRGDSEGWFAITPVVNYLLASLGFLCLFGWAAAHGMFRNIEEPKRKMLDTERLLDEPHNG